MVPQSTHTRMYQHHQPSEKYGKYDRVVTVPPPQYQHSLSSGYHGGLSRHRQPIEHPSANDTASEPMENIDAESVRLSQSLQGLTLDTEQNANPFQHSSTSALIQSERRVVDWQASPNGEDESFVIDTYHSNSLPSLDVDPEAGRSFDQGSSDEETGLQKSLSGIQSPPGMGGPSCSRQSSSGSQSSLDSSLSFHTVYPSDGFPRRLPLRYDDNKNQQQPRLTAQSPADHQHQTSSKPHTTASTDPYYGRSQSNPEGAYGPRPSGQSGIRQQINQNADQVSREGHEQKPTSVFITYAEEQQNPGFKRLVLQLTRTLLNNGVQVRLDMLESTLMSMSVSSWLDDNIQKCDFVIVCVSPSYKSEVEQQVLPETPDPHSLHTRYIYNRLLTEFIQNGSRNYRFIPVLIGGANRKHLPSLCLDTTVYEWPQQYEAIIYRLFKKEKYIQPRVGPPPRCTVETYGTHEERSNGQ